jgi:hypothetical protein
MYIDVHRKEYGKGKDRFTVVVDFVRGKVYIHAPLQMTRIYPIADYEEFEGNMEAFGRSKIDEA